MSVEIVLICGRRPGWGWLRGGWVMLAVARMVFVCVLAGLVFVVGCSGVAVAGVGRGFVLGFGGGVSGGLGLPGVVVVDRGSGDVFVADAASGVVDVFGSSGVFVGSFGEGLDVAGLAVDEATGEVFVAEPFQDAVVVFAPDGSGGWEQVDSWSGAGVPGGVFGEVTGVAVDNSTSASDPSAGDVYVVDGEAADSGLGAVDVFRPGSAGGEGVFVRSLSGARLEEPNGVTVNAASGRVYVADSEEGFVDAFSDAGVFEAKITGSGSPLGSFGKHEEEGNVTALAVDETTGDLLVAEGERRVVGEFGAMGGWLGWMTGTPAGPLGEPDGVAVSASGDVFVADRGLGVVDVFGQGVVVPDVSTGRASKVKETTVELAGTVNGLGKAVSYRFEWGEGETYGSSTPTVEGTGAGEETAKVMLTGLSPGTSYRFRLVAENENGLSCGVGGVFTTAPGEANASPPSDVACELPRASVEAESVTEVTRTDAVMHAQIDPHGRDTTYQFQYGTQDCSTNPTGCIKAPVVAGDAGSGEADVPVSLAIEGLQPNTTYHYRVLAANSLGAIDGAEQTFTTQAPVGSFVLPDGRAWEMVSPPDKQGSPIEALTREGGLILAAEDGDALAYVADGAITEEAQGNRPPEVQQIISTRTPQGWSTRDIDTPQVKAQGDAPGAAPEYQFFTPDLSLALVNPPGVGAEPPLAAGVTQHTMYIRDDETETYLPLVTGSDAPEASFPDQMTFLNATADLSHVVFESAVALTGPSSGPGLYEWVGGQLRFVSELPSGVPASEAALGYSNVAARALSSDGTRVIWTDSFHRKAQLFMRDTTSGETVRLDAAQGVSEPEVASAEFQSASSDGSRVFFTDKQRLTADSGAEPGLVSDPGRPDLYECEMVEEAGRLSCRLRDLTPRARTGEPADVQGLLFGASEEGSSVYLVAQGVLTPRANGEGQKAESGMDNLYLLREGASGWQTTFIGTLSGEDEAEWTGNDGQADTAFLTARVSPNGRYLAFMSSASLTGYDNEDATSEHPGERMDEEVYLYDADTASLTCVSCDSTGARPTGVFDREQTGEGLGLLVDRREIWLGHWLAGNIPGWTAQSLTSALFQSRYLSDQGRLFFDSPDDLVAQASNRQEDVYEYEPTGIGSCQSTAGGCVALISSGSSPNESAFLEATPTGNDVFFLTAARLSPQDTDDTFDVYDARVCTQQSPCLTPPPPPASACASAEACRPSSPSTPAPYAPAGSATFSGPGNLIPSLQPTHEVKSVKASSKPLTRAQKLAKALKACRAQHPHSNKRRELCEAHARKLYGPKPTAKRADTDNTNANGGGR